MTWQLTVDIPDGAWMTMNRDYGRTGYKKTLTDWLKNITIDAINTQKPGPLPDPCFLVWDIHYPKGVSRKADPENSAPTCKVIQDTLVHMGLIADDNGDHITSKTWRRGPNLTERGKHRIVLTAIDQEVPF